MQALTTTVFNLYLALVCAISLLTCVIIGGSGINSMVNFVFPTPVSVSTTRFDEATKTEIARDATIVAAEKADQQATQRIYEMRGMLHSFIYFILTGAVFTIHWRLFRRRVALADMLSAKPEKSEITTTKKGK